MRLVQEYIVSHHTVKIFNALSSGRNASGSRSFMCKSRTQRVPDPRAHQPLVVFPCGFPVGKTENSFFAGVCGKTRKTRIGFGRTELLLDLPHNTYEQLANGAVIIRKGSVRLLPAQLSML